MTSTAPVEKGGSGGGKRELTFLLANLERPVLLWLATRVPRSIRSNHLTGLGVLGATGAGIAYALTNYSHAWLWVASAMLVVNWIGDSLDGTLARVRGTQRPKYGYYLDHVVDAYSTAIIGLGLGLSPYVYLGIALGIVIVYLAMSINVYLESTVFGVFKISYGRVGPTEVRLILILLNTTAVITAGWPYPLGVPINRVANITLGIVLAGMVVLFVGRFARNLYKLAKLEPQRFKWWEQHRG
jgi:phosphatidylglycerophosphate synthase